MNARFRRSAALTLRFAAAVLFLSGLAAPTFAGESSLLVGAAKRKVTPPVWVPYLTSSGAGTSKPFHGIHDDLYARALVLDDGQHRIAVLAVDSIGYDNAVLGTGRDFTAELRERVSKSTGLKPGAVMLAASHTHSAPETLGISPARDEARFRQWIEGHLDDLVQTVVDAWRNRVPCELRFGKADVPGIARYRRIVLKSGKISRNGPLPRPEDVAIAWRLDEQLSLLYAQTSDGRPVAAMMNFTAHPVIAMLLPDASADYPGPAARTVEQALPGCVCLFTNGCAGNINSAAVTTSFDDVERLGGRLGHAAVELIGTLRHRPPLAETTVGFSSRQVKLAPRPGPGLEAARETQRQTPSAANARLYRLAARLAEGPPVAEVQMMHVGAVRWISLPGEPFVETGLALKQAGASFVVGYANGYLGYFPIRRAYDEGDYEVTPGVWSRVAPGSAERLEAVGKEMLRADITSK